MNPTPKELAAVFISRQVRNREWVSLGTNLPVCTAGVLLAHLTHAPDLKLNALNYFTNLSGIEKFDDLNEIASPRVARWAEALMSLEQMNDALQRIDLCFAGGMQIDRFGATNLIGVGEGAPGWKARGPGSVGTTSVMSLCGRYIIYTNNHSPKTLVDRCQYRSTAGWGEGGADARRRMGLVGGGPEWVVTPLAAFDFHPERKEMRLRYLFGSSEEEVLANMGFRPLLADSVEPAPEPTPAELAVLRSRIDVQGILR